MRGVVGAAALVATALAVLTPGCEREDLVVATVGDADTDAGVPCSTDDDCRGGSAVHCDKPGCGQVGTCQVSMCEDTDIGAPAPVCGCDGVTYWNACAMETVGESMLHDKPCGSEMTTQLCSNTMPCAPAAPHVPAFCSIFVHGRTCEVSTQGTCWVLPPDCSGTPDDHYFRACATADTGCETTCEAISSGVPVMYDEDGCE